MTRLRRPWPLAIVASSVALSLALALNLHGPVRGVLTLWFFLTCPGMAIVALLDVADPLAEAVLALALSIAIGMLLALAMLLTHTWSPDGAAAILVTLSIGGASAQIRAARGGRRGERPTNSDTSVEAR